MKHAIDFELGEHAIEQARVGNRAGELARDERPERRVERRDVERDDRTRRDADRRVTSPWPISPPAPVTRTTGLRMRVAAGSSSCLAVISMFTAVYTTTTMTSQ